MADSNSASPQPRSKRRQSMSAHNVTADRNEPGRARSELGFNDRGTSSGMSSDLSNEGAAALTSNWMTTAVALVQGATYSVTRSPNKSALLAVFIIVFEVIQLIAFLFTPAVKWSSIGVLSDVLAWANLRLVDLSVPLFYVALSLATLGLPVAIINVSSVGRSFQKSDFTRVWPLRTLRFFMGGFMDVLYIPVLSVFVSPLQCSHVDSVLVWDGLTSVKCWTWPFAVAQGIAIVDLVIYIPMCCAFILMSYNSIPLSQSTNAKCTGRIDAFNLFLKSALVIFNRLIPSGYMACISVLIVSTSFTFTQLYFLPYYNRRFNCFVSALYVVPGCIAIHGIVSQGSGGVQGLTISAFVTSFFVALAFAGLTELRIRYIIRRSRRVTVAGVLNNSVVSVADEDTAINPYEAWVRSVELSHSNSIPSAHFVEVFARCALDARNTDIAPAMRLQRAREIYEAGVRQFPNDAQVRVAYASFFLYFLNEPDMASRYLVEAKKLPQAVDLRFQVYAREHDALRERRAKNLGEDNLDVISYVELQKNMKHALRYHRDAIVKMRSFWGLLLQENASLVMLPSYMQQITHAEKRASEAYKGLVAKFSRSPAVMRHYANFCLNVTLDYDQAFYYYSMADAMADEKLANTRDQQAMTEVLSRQGRMRHRANREKIFNRRSVSTDRFARVIKAVLILMGICLIVQFALAATGDSMMSNSILYINHSSQRRRHCQNILCYTRLLEIGHNTNSTASINLGYTKLKNFTLTMRDVNRQLYEDTLGLSKGIDDDWHTPHIPLLRVVAEEDQPIDPTRPEGPDYPRKYDRITQTVGMWDAINAVVLVTLDIIGLDPKDYGNIHNMWQYKFLDDNCNDVIPNALENSVTVFQAYMDYTILLVSLLQSGIYLIIVVVLFLSLVLLFKPAFSAVINEKEAIVELFRAIPVAAVAHIYNNLKAGDNDEFDDDGDYGVQNNKTDSRVATGESATASSITKMSVQYKVALSYLLVMATVFFVVALVLMVTARHYGPEIRYTGAQRGLAKRMRFLAWELVVQDKTNYNETYLRESLLETTTNLDDYQRWVSSGNSTLGLPGNDHRYAPITDLLEHAQCIADDPSTCPTHPMSPVGSEGLQPLRLRYINLATQLYHMTVEEIMNTTTLDDLTYMDENALGTGLNDLTNLVQQESAENFQNITYGLSAIFSATLASMIFIYFVVFTPMVKLLREEGNKTAAMLLMIPPATIQQTEVIRNFFEAVDSVDAAAIMQQKKMRAQMSAKNLADIRSLNAPNGIANPLTGSGAGVGGGLRAAMSNSGKPSHSNYSPGTDLRQIGETLLQATMAAAVAVNARGDIVMLNKFALQLFALEFENQVVGQHMSVLLCYAELLFVAGEIPAVRMTGSEQDELEVEVRMQTFENTMEVLHVLTISPTETLDHTLETNSPGTIRWALHELNGESLPTVVVNGDQLAVVVGNFKFLSLVNEVSPHNLTNQPLGNWVRALEDDSDTSDSERDASQVVLLSSLLGPVLAEGVSPKEQVVTGPAMVGNTPLQFEATRLRFDLPGYVLITFRTPQGGGASHHRAPPSLVLP